MITFIKSILIGICAILPGVSGSVIAVSLGIYDKMLDIIKNPRLIKENKLFVIFVFFGLVTGIYMTSGLFIFIFKYKTILYYSLIGIIISEIPFLIKKIDGVKNIEYVSLLFSFFISLALNLLNSNNVASSYSPIKYFIGGILFAFGKVFPGVSSSFFLLCLGIYDKIIIIVTKPLLLIVNFKLYFPFLIGFIIGILLFISILSYLLNKRYKMVYSIILGFILSSIIFLIPKFSLSWDNIIGIILMIIFFLLFIYIKKKKDR